MEPLDRMEPTAAPHDHDQHDQHEHDHDQHEHDDHDPAEPELLEDAAPERHPLDRLARLAVDVGAGLVLVQAAFVALAIVQGLALQRQGPSSFDGDLLHRIGIVFSTSVNLQSGLALLLGVVLVSVPLALPADRRPLRALRRAVLVAIAVVAAVIAVGTILGVRASLHGAHLANPTVTAYQRWELTAYVAGTLGTALVAFLAALAAMPGDEEPRS